MTCYSVIGGWITRYFAVYLVSDGTQASQDGFFISFIPSQVSPIVFMLVFLALTAWVVYCGAEKSIEKYSRHIMPGLLLIIGIAAFSLTLSRTDENGERFGRAKLYGAMMRYVVPMVMLILFLTSTGFWSLLFRQG